MSERKKGSKSPAIPVHVPGVEMVDPASLTQHAKNPNKHGERQLVLYAKIIRAHGWRRAVVVSKRSMMVTKGNGAVQSSLAHGLGPVPVIYQPYASDAEELADMAADNELARMAENDEDALEALLNELKSADYDLELAGQLAELEADIEETPSNTSDDEFRIVIICRSVRHQNQTKSKLRKMGIEFED